LGSPSRRERTRRILHTFSDITAGGVSYAERMQLMQRRKDDSSPKLHGYNTNAIRG